MIAIVCVDDRMGMLFNHRRQSQDALLRARILQQTAGGVLRMNTYSAKQFAQETAPQVCVSENFLACAAAGDYCFVETELLQPYGAQIEQLILYRWNRHYPSEQMLDLDLGGWMLVSASDFAGSSHARITEEIYRKEREKP